MSISPDKNNSNNHMKEIAMKSKSLLAALLLAAALVFVINHNGIAQSTDRTVVYYFHGQFRCHSCTRIEELTRKALQKGFPGELAQGRIVWRPTNVDETRNRHFVARYKLTTRTVVVSKQRNSGEVRWKELPEVWSRLNDEASFIDYIQKEIRQFNN